MLDHIAEQIGVDAEVIAGFARRTPTRYDQLLAIKAHFGFADLTKPMRATLSACLEAEVDGEILRPFQTFAGGTEKGCKGCGERT